MAQRTDNVAIYEEVIPIVKEYETMVRSTKKGILNATYIQGIKFKQFKESHNFVERIKEIGLSKSTIYLK